jgi:hypothetical protein
VPAPLVENVTVPVGWLPVPIPLESVTVAVQAVADPDATEDGVHDTRVVVGRLLTVTVVVPLLPPWAGVAVSPL